MTKSEQQRVFLEYIIDLKRKSNIAKVKAIIEKIDESKKYDFIDDNFIIFFLLYLTTTNFDFRKY